MESHVPTAFAEVTKCFACDFLEDGRTLVGICTTSGQLLELVDKKVIDSFDIDKVADDIKIFTSYNPVQKYYLVHCKKQLIVVKRAKPLCIIHTYDNVVQVEIRDRLCLGRPQVVVWTLTEKEPIVTDFVSQLQPAGPQPVPNLTIGLSGKLQEMNLRLVKARKLLQEKRKTCVNALYQLTPHLTPPESDIKGEPQVLAWGAPFPAKGAAPQPPLRLSRLWARTHNGQWVVGVPVFNTNHKAVEDVRLRLRSVGQPQLRYQTHVVVFPQRVSSGAEWTELRQQGPLVSRQSDIPARTSAVVVGVLEEPLFKNCPVVSFSGVLLYRLAGSAAGTSIQELLDSVEFKVEDLIQGSLNPFSSSQTPAETDESQLVSVMVTSKEYQLSVTPVLGLYHSLDLKDHGLQLTCSPHCWVGQLQGSLAGLMVIQRHLHLDLYAKDVKQTLQFVQSLRSSQWKVEERSGDSAVTLTSCVKSLAAELRALLPAAQPNSHFTCEQWTEFRKKLNKLELETDLNFLSYVPPQ